jgi:hypothetical protein
MSLRSGKGPTGLATGVSRALKRLRAGKRRLGRSVGSPPAASRSTRSRKASSASPTATTSKAPSATTSSGTMVQWTPPATRGRSGRASRSPRAASTAQGYCWLMTEKPTRPAPHSVASAASSAGVGTSNSFSLTWTRRVSWPASRSTPEIMDRPWFTPTGLSRLG